jgi:hypothetical protein
VKSLSSIGDIFERNSFKDKHSLLLARYLVEPLDKSQIVYNEEASSTLGDEVDVLPDIIDQYQATMMLTKYHSSMIKSRLHFKNARIH